MEQESRLFEGEGNQVVGCLSVEVELLGKGSLNVEVGINERLIILLEGISVEGNQIVIDFL